LVAAYLVVRLIPTLRQALEDLEHLSWAWLGVAFALEILSETGFVISWHAVVDPDSRLGRDGRGRIDFRLAWRSSVQGCSCLAARSPASGQGPGFFVASGCR
jgi:hypothetical protein